MKRIAKGAAVVLSLLGALTACDGADDRQRDDASTEGASSNITPASQPRWYRPAAAVSWQWQLQGELNDGYAATIYDVDLLDTPASRIAQLQAAGHRVICYFSAGSFEQWRDDAGRFQAAVLGNPLDGWAGERWLDIRADKVRAIMLSRLDLAREKGCDGVEPDNVDGYLNGSGFDLTAEDQLGFNRFLAAEAHARGLAIGLKNDLDQVALLVDEFDFSVNEQCFEYAECDMLMPFISQNKPVLNAEYHRRYVEDEASRAAMCSDARKRRFSTLILPLALDDGFRIECRS